MQNAAVNCLLYLVLVAALFNWTLSLTMSACLSSNKHTLNVPHVQRIPGYQCLDPHSGKVFHNVFTYNQHHMQATKRGTLCESITMHEEVTGLCSSDTSTAALSARPTAGMPLISCITVLFSNHSWKSALWKFWTPENCKLVDKKLNKFSRIQQNLVFFFGKHPVTVSVA